MPHAIKDVTTFQECLLGLMHHNDDKAIRILGIYLATIGAVVTAGFALNAAKLLSPALTGFLIGGGIALLGGCLFAYAAAWRAEIYLAGRKPDFWRWAVDNDLTPEDVLPYYLDQAEACIEHNERLNRRSARMLSKSYLCGVSAPLVGALFTLVTLAAKCITAS